MPSNTWVILPSDEKTMTRSKTTLLSVPESVLLGHRLRIRKHLGLWIGIMSCSTASLYIFPFCKRMCSLLFDRTHYELTVTIHITKISLLSSVNTSISMQKSSTDFPENKFVRSRFLKHIHCNLQTETL